MLMKAFTRKRRFQSPKGPELCLNVVLWVPLPGRDHGLWDAVGSDAGQQLCVPLLLQGLLCGEVLKQKIKKTEVFACLTPAGDSTSH